MREISNFDSNNNLFVSSNFKCVNVNQLSCKQSQDEHFLTGLQNARRILMKIEQSIEKSKKYEEKLLKCKKSHSHTHDLNYWWDSDVSNSRASKCFGESKSSKLYASKSYDSSPVRIDESSTINIVCLQYKYEELLKRYDVLSKLYNERCSLLSSRDVALAALRERVKVMDGELQRVHRALLSVGKQYIDLKCRRFVQKVWYGERVFRLKCSMAAILSSAERARVDFDDKLDNVLNCEHDAAISLLLAEIKKCNLLFLENLRLKYRM